MKKSKKALLSIPLLLAAALAVFLLGVSRSEPPQASGLLERERIEIPSRSFERITSLEAEEGDYLSRGDIILRQDDRRALAALTAARADRDGAAARLERLKNGARPEEIRQLKALLTAAEGVLKEREDNLERLQELVQKNFSSQAELDSAESAWKQALGNRDELRARLDLLLAGARREELDEASAVLAAADAALEKARLDLEELTVRAPRDGQLESLPYEEGASPAAGRTLAVMLAGDRPYARVYIPEAWHGRLNSGDSVELMIDGLESPLEGRISRISTDPVFTPYFALNQSDRGRLSYTARIDLTGAPALEMKPGTPVRLLLRQAAREDKQ
jgi:HlyD family secretion protein